MHKFLIKDVKEYHFEEDICLEEYAEINQHSNN